MRHIRALLAMCLIVGVMAFLPVAAEAQRATELGTKQVDGLEVTLLSAPPTEMRQSMPGMGAMGRMSGMEGQMGSMPGMGGMGGSEAQPTHFLGVVVRDLKEDRTVRDLQVTLTAQKGSWRRTVTLMPMPGSYGAHVSLPEKGRYTVIVTILRSGQPLKAAFALDYR